jgi:hypothetical protein
MTRLFQVEKKLEDFFKKGEKIRKISGISGKNPEKHIIDFIA